MDGKDLLLPITPSRKQHNEDQNKDAVVIEVTDNLNKLLANSAGRLPGDSKTPYIYRIPGFMKDVQPKAFEPNLVSFGPYHHGKPHLVSMELIKQKALRFFQNGYGLEIKSIVKSVSTILEDLLLSYDKLEDEWKQAPGKFLEVMIVDGCFMVAFFMDCPLSLFNISSDIKRDILLLENQLPWVLLEELYSLIKETQDQGLRSLMCTSMLIRKEAIVGYDLHILEMYRVSLLYPPVDRKNRDGKKIEYEKSDPEYQIIPSATQLHDSGIKFKKSITKNLTDVTFDPKRGELSIPHLVVDDDTETNFLNVMAFEKLHLDVESKVTSFVIFMNNLLDVDKDVALLASEKIFANALGNDDSAAKLFSLLGKGAAMDLDSDITEVHYLVNQHCSQSWNQWCASLKHDYFQNPWAIISLFAAFFGFAILIVQVVYQIVDYHLRGN